MDGSNDMNNANTMESLEDEEMADSSVDDSGDENEATNAFNIALRNASPSGLYLVNKVQEWGRDPNNEFVAVGFKHPRDVKGVMLSIYDFDSISRYPGLYECVPFLFCSYIDRSF